MASRPTGKGKRGAPSLGRRRAAFGSGWALGLGSLFMDVSSGLIHSLLPIFVVGTLGAGATSLGVIAGIAAAGTCIVKAFAGVLADHLARRKPLALLGYGLAAFGLRQSLDTIGALAGPLLAMVLATSFRGDVRAVFWIAVVPAVMSVAILWVSVKEPLIARATSTRALSLQIHALPAEFWTLGLVATFFTLARFSEGFLVLSGAQAGLPVAWTPLTLVVVNLAYLLSAYPAAWLSDFMPRSGFLIVGCVVLIAANLVLASAAEPFDVLLGCALWGVHIGLTEGVFLAMVANATPAHLRASAIGVFDLMRGTLLLAASVIAGVLWDLAGPAATFMAAAMLATVSLAAYCLARFFTKL